jgi:hypothetical protein
MWPSASAITNPPPDSGQALLRLECRGAEQLFSFVEAPNHYFRRFNHRNIVTLIKDDVRAS